MSLKTPLTPDEVVVIAALRRVRYPAASWDKRFANQLSDDGLTEKQRPQVWRLFIRYRRQINCPDKARILAMAEKLAAPDFRKQQAAEREQARINQLKKEAEQRGCFCFPSTGNQEQDEARAEEIARTQASLDDNVCPNRCGTTMVFKTDFERECPVCHFTQFSNVSLR